MITTIMSALTLVALSVPSLVPTQAIAQEEDESIEDALRQTYADFNKQEDVGENEGGYNSVISDPIVQTSVQPAVNVDANANVITDKENCIDASDNVNQRSDLSSNQVAGSNGEVGEGSTVNIPIYQREDAIARNKIVDNDITIPLSLPQ